MKARSKAQPPAYRRRKSVDAPRFQELQAKFVEIDQLEVRKNALKQEALGLLTRGDDTFMRRAIDRIAAGQWSLARTLKAAGIQVRYPSERKKTRRGEQ